MAKELWLPSGYELADGSRIRSLRHLGETWQIFDTNGSVNILLASQDLASKWNEQDFLDEAVFFDLSL